MPLPYAAALPKAKGVPKNPQQCLIVVLYILRNPPATSAALPKGLFDDEKEQNQKNTFASINIYCSHSHALQQRTSPPPPPSPPHGLPASSTPLQSIATSQPASFATRPPPPLRPEPILPTSLPFNFTLSQAPNQQALQHSTPRSPWVYLAPLSCLLVLCLLARSHVTAASRPARSTRARDSMYLEKEALLSSSGEDSNSPSACDNDNEQRRY